MSKVGFTHEELTELGRIMVTSHGKFDRAFDTLLSSRGGGHEVKGWPRRAFVVGMSSIWMSRVGETVRDTGAGAQLRGLYAQQPEDPAGRAHIDRWLEYAEQPTEATPDQQASACLALLNERNAIVFQHRWLASLAARRLAHLLAQYPVLLHPRFAWEVKERHVKGVPHEPVPMLHAMLLSSVATLPSPYWDVDEAALERFATHPALVVALRCKSPPVLDDSSATKSRTFSVAEMMNDRPRIAFVDALLRIERIRHVAQVAQGKEDHGFFEPGTDDHLHLRKAVSRAFTSTWLHPYAGGSGGFPRSLFNEIAATPVHPRTLFAEAFLRYADRVFHDEHTASGLAIAADAPARFDRLVQNLDDCGVFGGSNLASRVLLGCFFPDGSADEIDAMRRRTGLMSLEVIDNLQESPHVASVEVAHAFITKWLSTGVEPAELAGRIRRVPYGGDDWAPQQSWRQALNIVETERAMIAAIDAAAPAEGSRMDSAVTRRRALV